MDILYCASCIEAFNTIVNLYISFIGSRSKLLQEDEEAVPLVLQEEVIVYHNLLYI